MKRLEMSELYGILNNRLPHFDKSVKQTIKVWGVPRGGIPAAALAAHIYSERGFTVQYAKNIESADIIVDDIVDSGATRNRIMNEVYPKIPYFTSIIDMSDPADEHADSGWIVFPWEETDAKKDTEDHVHRVRQFYGRVMGAIKVLFSSNRV